MPKYKPISREKVIKILCKEFGFHISGKRGSHVRLSKVLNEEKIGTVVPNHKELKEGTLKGALKLAKVVYQDFSNFY